MVQRKAPDNPKSPIEHKKSQGRLEKQFSSHLQQDTSTRGGADLKKKLKKVSNFDSVEHSPTDIQFKKTSPCKKTSPTPIRNYMKPTSSSDDKKKSPRSSKNSNSSSVKALSRQSSLKAVRSSMKKSSVVSLCAKKSVNRATCSSTLKDSKFPSGLELSQGATEAEGTSKIRVCPYTYCSLNGHMHDDEPLPTLKCFVSARRKLLKTQRSLKVKGLFSFKTEDEIGKNPSVLFVEIYTTPQEETIEENNCDEISILEEKDHEQCMIDEVGYFMETMSQMNESSDTSFEYDHDMDQNSEFSQDEMDDVMMNFLEYVEFDHERTTAQKEYEGDGEKTMEVNLEEEICLFPDEQISVNTANSYVASEEAEDDCNISEFNSQSINVELQKLASEMMNCQSDESSFIDEYKIPEKELQEASNETDRNILKVSDGILSSRWNNVTKKRTEEFEQVNEFNPRSPNFLPSEPDPEAEKVDLRHQMMDGRKNSEEWMIDYALQQAVTKLGSARKRKVALLVEAFETVIPLPMCEKPLSHGSSTFNHLSFIQACN